MNPAMERPERYDPEDLEHLMLERSFDELLAEEQAFALRHLRDRAEYERMRALLHQVQQQRQVPQNRDADPAVRERVLAAFRAKQQPHWRIWLNSVGAFLFPERPAAYWRPVLAMGLVAVVAIAVLRLSTRPDQAKVLAEAKSAATNQHQETPGPAVGSPESVAPPVETPAAGTNAPSQHPTTAQEEAVDSNVPMNGADATELPGSPVQTSLAEASTIPDTFRAMDGIDADRAHEDLAVAKQAAAKRAEVAVGAVTISETAAAPTNAKLDRAHAQEHASYTEDDLLGLLQAVW